MARKRFTVGLKREEVVLVELPKDFLVEGRQGRLDELLAAHTDNVNQLALH